MRLGLDLNPLTQQERPYLFFGVTHDRKGWAIPFRAGPVRVGRVWLDMVVDKNKINKNKITKK